MIRKALWLSATSAFLTLFTIGGHAEDRVLNVFNWSDYIDSSVIDDFTKETGIKVVYDTFDSNEILETKLLAGGSGYDVVVPSGNFLARQIQAGVFQKLDKAKLPNIYNIKKVQAALGTDKIDSWDTFFNPETLAKLKDCGVYVLDSPADMIPAALKYLGLDPNSTSPDDIAKAEEALMKVRPYIRKFHSSEYINALANGDICLAIGFSGDVFQARSRAEEAKQGVEIGYSVPKEGAQIWFDQMAIPADAPHVAEAHEFINYMMKPEVIAKSSNFVLYANGNKASQQFVDKTILDDQAIYPDTATMDKLYTVQPYDPKAQRIITRTWTKIVTGQ
jgi:putrescine transport system substrate-binding protein